MNLLAQVGRLNINPIELEGIEETLCKIWGSFLRDSFSNNLEYDEESEMLTFYDRDKQLGRQNFKQLCSKLNLEGLA